MAPIDESLDPAPAPYPGFWQAVGLLLLYGFFAQCAIAPFWFADKLRHGSMVKHPGVIALVLVVSGLLVLRLVCRRLQLGVRDIVAVVPFRPDLLVPMAATVIGVLLLELPAMFWVVRRFPALTPKDDLQLDGSVWGAVLLGALAAPLIEEMLFRGIFLRGFVPRYGAARGVALGAAMFAAVHVYPVKLPGTMLIGLIFGWWFVKLRSIWPGVFGHALNNSIAVVGEWWDPALAGDTVPPFTWAEPVAAAIGALMLAGGVLALRRKFRDLESEPPAKAG